MAGETRGRTELAADAWAEIRRFGGARLGPVAAGLARAGEAGHDVAEAADLGDGSHLRARRSRQRR